MNEDSQELEYESPLNSRMGCMALIAVLVDRLGGTVTVTQEDYDAIAYRVMNEKADEIATYFELEPKDESRRV